MGLLVAVLLLAFLAAGAVVWITETPYGPAKATIITIAPGASTVQIGRQLEAAGIVHSRFAFDLMRFLKRGTLKAGEYRFSSPISAAEVYDCIERGETYTILVTIPEGANIFDIATRLEKAGIGTRRRFLQAAVKRVLTDPKVVAEGEKVKRYIEFVDAEKTRTKAVSLVASISKRRKTEIQRIVRKDYR